MNAIAYTDWIMPPSAGMGIAGIHDATYSKKGITPSLALIPFVIAAEIAPWLTTRATAMFLNPLVTAATACVLYTFIRRLKFRPRTAFTVALLYGSATFAVVYAKTLFGEPLTALLILIAAVHTHRLGDHPRRLDAFVIGVCIGLLAGINTIYALYVPVFGIAALVFARPRNFRQLVSIGFALALPVMVSAALLMAFNLARFGDVLQSGYRFTEGEGFIHPITTGLFGLFLSPYRGLFWYSPLLLLSIPGAVTLLREKRNRRSTVFFLVVILAQALMFASWWSWHGGVVWGARFLIPVTPLITLMLAPLVEKAWSNRLLFIVIGAFAFVSIFVQALGALYSHLPHYAYLVNNHFTGDFYAPATSLEPAVFTDLYLSPLVGHIALMVSGWALEPVALREQDWIHLLAALSVSGIGLLALRQIGKARWIVAAAVVTILVALNIIGARQTASADVQHILALGASIPADSTVLAYTTAYGAALLDLEGQREVITLNAPLSDNRQNRRLLEYALRPTHATRISLITWSTVTDQAGWVERRLWERTVSLTELQGYFESESAFDGHRIITFRLLGNPLTRQPIEAQFGNIHMQFGTLSTPRTLYLALNWESAEPLASNFTWFVHLIDANGTILDQVDHPPVGGLMPTSQWQVGQTVTDWIALDQPPQAAALRIGWIDPLTGAPLLTPSGESFVMIPLESLIAR